VLCFFLCHECRQLYRGISYWFDVIAGMHGSLCLARRLDWQCAAQSVWSENGVVFLTSYAVIVSARSFAAAVTPAAKYFK
jgi:hypothetical protein